MTGSQPTDAKGNALLEVLSRCRSHACFRYPIDGPNEIEKAIDDAIEEVFGPRAADSAYAQAPAQWANPIIRRRELRLWGHSLPAQGSLVPTSLA
jgi:hypothetical protein